MIDLIITPEINPLCNGTDNELNVLVQARAKDDYQVIKKKYHINNENISSLFVIKKNKVLKKNSYRFVDPLDLTELKDFKNYFYSVSNFRIFPIIDDVKIFNDDTQLFLPSMKKSK